ncbi:unnamed protein product [Victoria cruziana]
MDKEGLKSRSGREGILAYLPWLLLSAFLVSVCWIIINQPFGVNFFAFQIVLLSPSSSRQQQEQLITPSVAGTTIRGSRPVASFRSYLRCLSESGRWVYNATPRHIPWNYAAETYTERCDESHNGLSGEGAERASLTAQNWTVREELKWTWQTNGSCPNQPVDRDELCKLIGTRGNLMVVGDSINHGLQWTITNNLIRNPSAQIIIKAQDPVCRNCLGYPVCEEVLGTGRGFNASFIRNDRLSTNNKTREDRVTNFLEWPWKDYINEWNVKILILNRGHRNCMNHKKPLERRQSFSRSGADNKYHWRDIQRQNRLVKGVVEEFGFIYIDADSLLSRRADGHVHGRDCLHYCIPGPLDSLVQLLYNTLKVIPSFGHTINM